MIRYLHTICTHLRKIEENKRYYLKRKYYLWAWKSRGMDMKRNSGDWYKNKRPVSVHSTTPVFYPFIHQSSFYFTSMPLFFKVIFNIVVYFVY